MTKKQVTPNAPSVNELREEQELRLHKALADTVVGSDAYTKILAQITALSAHARAVNLKNIDGIYEGDKQQYARELEFIKHGNALELEREKQDAAKRLKQLELAGKIGAIALVIFFEINGHAIISKSFGMVKD